MDPQMARWTGWTSVERKLDFLHNPIRLGGDLRDLLIVADVVPRQRTAAAVLEPFLRRLVAADVEAPGDRRHLGEILVLVDVDLASLELRKAARDDVVALAVIGIGRLADGGWLHQVQAAELL